MDDIYKNIEECNTNKKQKILIAFDDMIADMLSNKTCNPIVLELHIQGRQKVSNLGGVKSIKDIWNFHKVKVCLGP